MAQQVRIPPAPLGSLGPTSFGPAAFSPTASTGSVGLSWNSFNNAGIKPASRWADFSPMAATPLAQRSPTANSQVQPVLRTRRTSTSGLASVTEGTAVARQSRWADLEDTPMAARSPQLFTVRSPVSSQVMSSVTTVQPQARVASKESVLRPSITSVAPVAAVTRRRWADVTPLATSSPGAQAPKLSFHIDSARSSPAPSATSPPESDDEDESPEGQMLLAEYPCTPLARSVRREDDPEKGTLPRIGIDIGGVLTRDGDPMRPRNGEWDLSWEAPGAFEVVWQLVQVFGPTNVFLVSKVRPGGSMQMQIEHWLHEVCKFCEITGVRRENIFFVSKMDGPDGKGVTASRLGLTHFVDDKLTCLNSVFSDDYGNSGDLVSLFDGVLFHFAKGGYGHSPPQVRDEDMPPEMRAHYCGVANWANVRDQLRTRLPGILRDKGNSVLVPENVLKIDPNLERKAKPLFSRAAERAAEERPPWYHAAVSPTAARAASAAPASMSWRNQTTASATSPTANRARSGQPAALQVADGARPRLVLKTRDPTLGAVNARSVVNVSLAAQGFSPSPRNAQIVASSPKAASLAGQATRPSFSLAACLPSPKAAVVSRAPILVKANTAPAAPAGPALRQDAVGGRPKLMLKPRTAEQPQTAAPAGAALQADPSGGRPKLVLKPRTAEQPQTAAPAGPALQADPSGGRPKLMLKPRTAEPPKSAGSFMADLQNKLSAQ